MTGSRWGHMAIAVKGETPTGPKSGPVARAGQASGTAK